MRLLSLLKDEYRIITAKWNDLLYKITKNDKYLIYWETPFYTNSATFSTPISDEFQFFLYIPFVQEKDNEYFIVADGYDTDKCKKVAKLSLQRPEYFKGGILTGKKKWVLTHDEKERLCAFLNDTTHWTTSGRSWFQDMLIDYNTALSSNSISEDLPIPDYMKLPEN